LVSPRFAEAGVFSVCGRFFGTTVIEAFFPEVFKGYLGDIWEVFKGFNGSEVSP
jgi:hypothetical protein